MRRLLLVTLSVLLLGSGCGSSGSTPGSADGKAGDAKTGGVTPQPSDGASNPPGVTYFTQTESDSINAIAGKATQAGAKAVDDKQVQACNKAAERGPGPYRTCLHALLEPVASALGDLAAEFGRLAGREFPPECVTSLGEAQVTFTGLSSRVAEILGRFDSEDTKAQNRAARTYYKSLEEVSGGFTKPFQEMTQACYSPQDLASINASPSASPGP